MGEALSPETVKLSVPWRSRLCSGAEVTLEATQWTKLNTSQNGPLLYTLVPGLPSNFLNAILASQGYRYQEEGMQEACISVIRKQFPILN